MQALKKKYAEQRLARSVIESRTLTRSQTTTKSPPAKSVKAKQKVKKKSEASELGGRLHTRETRSSIPPKRQAAAAAASTLMGGHKKKIPSSASIVARRKTRMATLAAVTKGMSKKMLTRLAPRGTSNANFIKNIRTKPVNSARSLRGREVSVSTDEEEDEEEEVDEKEKVFRVFSYF